MRILIVAISSLILSLGSANICVGQGYKKGNILIDAYYGFPNIMYSKWNYFTSQYLWYTNSRANSIGPIGGRVEYLFSERIGIGIEGSYANTIIDYDFNASPSGSPNSYEVTITRFRIIPRFNFHFGKSSKVDPYITGGIGYYYRSIQFTPSNPVTGHMDPSTNQIFGANWPFSDSLYIPVAFTARFGVHYFFNDRIGAGAEVGFGGPLLTLGLTGKF